MCQDDFDFDDCPDGFGDSFESQWAEDEMRADRAAQQETLFFYELGLINRFCPECYSSNVHYIGWNKNPDRPRDHYRCEKCGHVFTVKNKG